MPARRMLTMRQLRRIMRLHHEGASAREIVRAVGAARSTVQDALKRAASAQLFWPLPDDLTDEVLEARLFARPGGGAGAGVRKRPEPDWGQLVRELRRPAVTMMILWEEYRQACPDGYGYSRFCELLRAFQQRLSPVMRQHHIAGDKLFVDYSGKRLGITDPATGEIRMAEIFVAVLGASNYTFAEVTWSQALPDWIGSHVRLFAHIKGVPRLLVPDNLKSGVNKASFYDPEINRSYGRNGALRRRGAPDAAEKAPRQGCGGSWSALCPDLHSGPASQSDLLLTGRGERRHCHGDDADEHPADAQARRQSRGSAGDPGSACAQALAADRL